MLKAPIVVIDGPSGAGKTTLAAALAAALDGGLAGGTQVVHLDDLYQGWADGPDGGAARLAEQVLTPLVTGQSATYYRYNWQAGCFADEPVFVHPDRPVVVEGSGAGAGAAAVPHLPHLLVWVDPPADIDPIERAIARDGEQARTHLIAWTAAESQHFAREDTRQRAHIVVDGAGDVNETVERLVAAVRRQA